MSRITPAIVAFFLFAGLVLARFSESAVPPGYLARPLAVAAIMAAIIGVVSLATGSHAVLVTVVTAAGLVTASLWVVVGACLAGIAMIVGRITGRTIDLNKGAVVGAAVFFLAGVVVAAPLLGWPRAAPAEMAIGGPEATGPIFLVLLDGYPRADTLSGLGIDISPFVDALEERGFVHYPDARSEYGWTHHTLTAMLGGVPNGDDFGTAQDRRAAREAMRLPDGFAYIPPTIGHVTIPEAKQIGTVGVTDFEINLVRRSLLGRFDWVGNRLLDSLHDNLERSLDVLEETNERQVFAHLLAPHTPFLFGVDGVRLPVPDCWPGCELFDINLRRLGLSIDDWVAGTAGNLEYLNGRLISVVDAILEREPDAAIILFSDHGGRYSETHDPEWHRVFLAARNWHLDDPGPGAILQGAYS